MITRKLALALMLVLALMVGMVAPALADSGESGRGVEPDSYPGNFVSSDDDQVCYDMSALGYIGEVTSEMRGFKIDPPVNYNDGYVSTTLSADGKYLDWKSFNATVLAFIIKGGPSYHVYNYVGTGFEWDNELHSPLNKKNVPAISHYNVCYALDEGDQGCTPGYWRNHADRWIGVAPADDFDATFGVDLFNPDITLGQAIWLGGGGVNAFARHATAALLNAYGGVPNADGTTVAYPYTAAEVIQMVQDAVANGTIEATKDLFEAANELGCPLSGTPASPASTSISSLRSIETTSADTVFLPFVRQ
jgi:hypothetical protein